jgi:hypothetical protein
MVCVPFVEDLYWIGRVGIGPWHPPWSDWKHVLAVGKFANGTEHVVEIVPDTGYNIIAMPVHWMNIVALWFLSSETARRTWHFIVAHFESSNPARFRFFCCDVRAYTVHFGCIWTLVVFATLAYFLKYTSWHLLPYCQHCFVWKTPELPWNFSNAAENPPVEVLVGVITSLFSILVCAAAAVFVATVDIAVDNAKTQFMRTLVLQQRRNRQNDTSRNRQRTSLSTSFLESMDSIQAPDSFDTRAPQSSYAAFEEVARTSSLTPESIEKSYSDIVRWMDMMERTIGFVVSWYTICIVLAGFAFAFVDGEVWPIDTAPGPDGSVKPDPGGLDKKHEWRAVLLLLLVPQLLVPFYCVAVGARANSQSQFTQDISTQDARGAFMHFEDISTRTTLVLRMTTTPLPQIRMLGIPITVGLLKAIAVVLVGFFTQRGLTHT